MILFYLPKQPKNSVCVGGLVLFFNIICDVIDNEYKLHQ